MVARSSMDGCCMQFAVVIQTTPHAENCISHQGTTVRQLVYLGVRLHTLSDTLLACMLEVFQSQLCKTHQRRCSSDAATRASMWMRRHACMPIAHAHHANSCEFRATFTPSLLLR
eukprot:363275-Chlamydomonas_euryale.AAC.6